MMMMMMMMMMCLRIIIYFVSALAFTPKVHAQNVSGLNQAATVFINTICENPHTGAIVSENIGTGFIVEKSGYILTVAHVVACESSRRKRTDIRVGSPLDPFIREVSVIRQDDIADLAILQIVGSRRDYPVLQICTSQRVGPEMAFKAAGFPQGLGYQPVDGLFGNVEGPEGNWSVASPFERGMSGGPVAHNGFVIGLIKAGVTSVPALSVVIPISKAKKIIEEETAREVELCPGSAPSPSGQENDEVKHPGPNFFKPKAVFMGSVWGFWMPAEINSKYWQAEVWYSSDGNYYQKSQDGKWFHFSELPSTEKLYLKVILPNEEVIGPFEYDIDYRSIRTSAIIKERLASGAGTAMALEPAVRDKNSFSLIIDYRPENKTLIIEAVVPEAIARYKISVGHSFPETLPVGPYGKLELPFLENPEVTWEPEARFSVTAIASNGTTYGPSFFTLNFPALIRRVWARYFNENDALDCEYDPVPRQTLCVAYPGYDTWVGIAKIDYGKSPGALNSTFTVPHSDGELTVPVKIFSGRMISRWEERCSGGDRRTTCFFNPSFKGAVPNIYARLYYYDGRVSDVLRYKVRNVP